MKFACTHIPVISGNALRLSYSFVSPKTFPIPIPPPLLIRGHEIAPGFFLTLRVSTSAHMVQCYGSQSVQRMRAQPLQSNHCARGQARHKRSVYLVQLHLYHIPAKRLMSQSHTDSISPLSNLLYFEMGRQGWPETGPYGVPTTDLFYV